MRNSLGRSATSDFAPPHDGFLVYGKLAVSGDRACRNRLEPERASTTHDIRKKSR